MNGFNHSNFRDSKFSITGHLSNAASKTLLNELQHAAHLNETNNTPQKAVNEIGQALTRCKPRLYVASQNECGFFQ